MNDRAALVLSEAVKGGTPSNEQFIQLVRDGDVRGLKSAFGFTSRQIADMMGSSKNTVHDIIRGRRTMGEGHKQTMLNWLAKTTGADNA